MWVCYDTERHKIEDVGDVDEFSLLFSVHQLSPWDYFFYMCLQVTKKLSSLCTPANAQFSGQPENIGLYIGMTRNEADWS